jgi:hypothetical protein
MTIIALVTKILAALFGSMLIIYGCCVGVIGVAPTGDNVHQISERAFGIYVLLLGVLYCLPNSVIIARRWWIVTYYIVTNSPTALLLYVIHKSITLMVRPTTLLCISLLAPLSLTFHLISRSIRR